VAELKTGDYFGEVAMLSKLNRTATVKSLDFTVVAYLERKDFEAEEAVPIIQPSFKARMFPLYMKRDPNLKRRAKTLLGHEYF
jgi:CRP-like cAMP-binding protein